MAQLPILRATLNTLAALARWDMLSIKFRNSRRSDLSNMLNLPRLGMRTLAVAYSYCSMVFGLSPAPGVLHQAMNSLAISFTVLVAWMDSRVSLGL